MGTVGNLKRLLRVAVLVGIATALIAVPIGVSANPDIDGFELDGNAAGGGGSDWDALGSPLEFTGFLSDPTGPSDTGYTGGQSKDTSDISQWKWATGQVTPAKDNIRNSYAAAYVEDGNFILYFGQNRVLDQSGDANVGFWFLQGSIGLNASGTFSGSHQNGDLLVQSGMTNGGDVSEVDIYKWQGGSLVKVSDNAECVSGKLGTGNACGIANTGSISTSWAGSIASPYFFEGGLNLSALYPGQSLPCFSTFLTNTRSSQSESATLKDFSLGSIDTCGSIKITKQATPSDGTQFGYTATGLSPSSFSLTNGGNRLFDKLNAGSYSVSENAPAGAWAFDSLSCPTVSGPGTSVQVDGMTVNITLGILGNVECTYVNKRQPQLTVIKHVVTDHGGTAVASAWTMQVKQGATVVESFAGAESPGTTKTLTAGSYQVVETGGPSGYALSYSGDCDASGNVSLAMGDAKTCVLTNNDAPATLTVIKHVINDNGGTRVAPNFAVHVAGTNASPANFAGAESPGTAVSIGAGSYSVTETEDPGYTASYSAGCSGSLPLGGSATCTITNDDKPATLIVKKVVVNDNGGSATPDDFSFQVNGGTAQAFQADGQNDLTVNAGTYSVTEPAVSGYTTSYENCTNIVIPNGGSATCTVTNDDQPATLIVRKVVVNDNGGTKQSQDFSFSVNGGPAQPFEADGQNNLTVAPGTYSVSEPAVAGYETSYDNCSNLQIPLGGSATCTVTNDDKSGQLIVKKVVVNDNGGTLEAEDFSFQVNGGTAQAFEADGQNDLTVDAGTYNVVEPAVEGYVTSYDNCSNLVIANGGSATCTVTNNDSPASLTVIKHVINDNGGTKAAGDFAMHVAGNNPSPANFAGAEAPGTAVAIGAGAYTVTETELPGYTASYSAGCSGTLPLGGSATCTVTNDDQPATLIVKKIVVNDDGGTLEAEDFSFQVNGGTAQAFEADGQNDLTVDAGTYNVVEPAVDGYETSYDGCSGIQLAPGGTATCTVTNDDEAGTLIVIKHVVNDHGGTAVAASWDMNVDGPTDLSFLGAEAPGTSSLVEAGAYKVTESGGPAGYALSYSGDCDEDGDVTVGLAQTKTCTLTNDDLPATLIVKKVVVNDNGGTKVAGDFSFSVNGGQAQPFEADGQNDLTVAAGAYSVSEPAVSGYATTYNNCTNVVIPLGGSATCTVTNNDVPRGVGSIQVSKSADPITLAEPGGQVAYSVRITNTSLDVDVTITNVVDDRFGDLDDDGGNGCFDVPINLGPGQFSSCQFTKQITGAGGTSHVNVVTASGHDENGHPVSGSDDARVDITPRLIDLVIVKDASSPTPLNGIVNYTMTVTNKGPDTATNVQLADPAPAGITYLSATPSQGTCSVSPALVTCSLGSIAAGETVTVKVTGRATQVGRLVNTATVTGSGGRETNPADNVDDAVTVVPAPLKPPTAKPTPKPEFCLNVVVSPKMVKADGKMDRLVVKVTAGGKRVKNAKVLVTGAGVRKTAKTNAKGIAVVRLSAKKPGLITVTTLERQKVCGAKRIGVVGVFLPPLTG